VRAATPHRRSDQPVPDQPIATRPTTARLTADARALIAPHALGLIDQDGDGGRANRRGAGGEAAPPAAIQPEVTDPLVVLIQAEPGMAQRLLSAHADDGTGRCRTCSTGAQTGRFQWPCTIHKRAHQAHETSGAARTD
jgi:hypothetical protein